MALEAKYAHTSITAQDLAQLTSFYMDVFDCIPVTGEGTLSGKWVGDVTGVKGAEIRRIHLRLPGWGDQGPTLEILQYSKEKARQATAANRPGFTHVAFEVDDVQAAQEAVVARGGAKVGKIISVDLPGRGHLTAAYVTDPEGNILELMHWSR